jgi:hypothetical protein
VLFDLSLKLLTWILWLTEICDALDRARYGALSCGRRHVDAAADQQCGSCAHRCEAELIEQ